MFYSGEIVFPHTDFRPFSNDQLLFKDANLSRLALGYRKIRNTNIDVLQLTNATSWDTYRCIMDASNICTKQQAAKGAMVKALTYLKASVPHLRMTKNRWRRRGAATLSGRAGRLTADKPSSGWSGPNSATIFHKTSSCAAHIRPLWRPLSKNTLLFAAYCRRKQKRKCSRCSHSSCQNLDRAFHQLVELLRLLPDRFF